MNKKLIAPIVTAGAMLAMSIGSTFALFTSKDEANIAITAGKISISAMMDDPVLYSADYEYIPESGDPEECLVPGGSELGSHSGTYYYKAGSTFANGGTGEVVNGDLKLTRMSPGDKAVSKIIINKGETNIDIKYRIVCELIEEDDDSLRFFSSLEFTALGETRTHVRKFATNWTYWDNEETEISSPVKVVLPITVGNEVQVSHCTLRFSVEAIQGNAYTVDDIDNLFVQFTDKKVEAAPVEDPTPSGLKDLDLEAWKDKTLIESEDATVKVHVPAGSGDVKALVETAPGVQEKQDLQLDDTLTLKVEEKEYGGTYVIQENDEVLNYEISLYNQNQQKIITVEEGEPLDVYINIGILSNIKEVLHSGEELDMNNDDTLEVGEYEYDESTGIVHILTNTFSPFSVIYEKPFAGGNGTAENPLLIANANQWVAMCTIYSFGNGEYCIYYPADVDGLHVKLIDDIDLKDVDLPYCNGVYGLNLNGNNKTVRNINSCNVFSNNSCSFYDNCNIYDITFENCTTSQGLFGNSTSSSYPVTLNFKNVDAKNCKTNANGGMLSQASSANLTFEDCDLINFIVNGYYYGCGGFIGNNSKGTNIFKNCTFKGTVCSDSGQVGGFIGQGPNYSSTSIVIDGCTVLSGSVIKSVGGGSVCAYDGHNVSHDYGSTNHCYGTLQSAGNKYAQGSSASMETFTPVCTENDFAINDDGSLTYTGSARLGKVVVIQQINNRDYIYLNSQSRGGGGFNTNIESVTVNNINSGDKISGLTKLDDFVCVVSEGNTAIGGHTTTDQTNVGKIVDNVYYFDSITYVSSSNGPWYYYIQSLSDGLNPKTGDDVKVTLEYRINIYEEDGSYGGSISSATLHYDIYFPVGE